MQRMINTHIEASKIGRQIAEQVLDYQRRLGDVSSGNKRIAFIEFVITFSSIKDSSPDPDPTLAQTISIVSENQLNASPDIDHGSAGNSSSAYSTSQRINGTYANFTTYNHARSSTIASPVNGEQILLFELLR